MIGLSIETRMAGLLNDHVFCSLVYSEYIKTFGKNDKRSFIVALML